MKELSKVFAFGAAEVRTVVIEGEPWFVAGDVSSVLGFRMASDMTRILDEDEKGTHNIRTLGGEQRLAVISESGIYAAILRSRKPEARAFKRWITHEVLPTIRKTGGFVSDEDTFISTYLPYADESTRTMFRVTLETIRKQTEHIAVIQPKADKYTEFLDSEGLTAFTTIGKHFLGGVEPPELTKFLQGHGVLYGREVDNCYPPRKGYEKYFRIIPFYRGGYLLNKTIKATPAGIDFIVELYRKHGGKVPEPREGRRRASPVISVNPRNRA